MNATAAPAPAIPAYFVEKVAETVKYAIGFPALVQTFEAWLDGASAAEVTETARALSLTPARGRAATIERIAAHVAVPARCQYDSGAATGCQPACSARPAVRVHHRLVGLGVELATFVCKRHEGPTLGRIYPTKPESVQTIAEWTRGAL